MVQSVKPIVLVVEDDPGVRLVAVDMVGVFVRQRCEKNGWPSPNEATTVAPVAVNGGGALACLSGGGV